MVFPLTIALMKFAASLIAEGVCPDGGTKNRFSTLPSSMTSTTMALSGANETNSTCLIGVSLFGVRTRLALFVNLDRITPTRSRIPETSEPPCAAADAIRWRSSLGTSEISRSSSTNIRSPSSVGTRPADAWALCSSPKCSRSCIALRIVAADTLVSMSLESVRDPIGAPFERYVSTRVLKTSLLRLVKSSRMRDCSAICTNGVTKRIA